MFKATKKVYARNMPENINLHSDNYKKSNCNSVYYKYYSTGILFLTKKKTI